MVDRLTELRENIYRALTARDYSAAQPGIEQLIELEPAEGLGLLTAMHIEQGDVAAAEQALARLVAVREDAYTEFLRARILFMQHRYVSARDSLLAVVAAGELEPAVGEKVYNLLGQCYRELGEAADAVAAYRRAAEVAPTPELRACEYSNYLFNSHYVRSELVEQRRVAAAVNQIFAEIKLLEHDMARHLAHRKIRIGYIAPELKEHVVLCFVYAFFAAYDSEQFEVYAYANNVEDDYSAHLQTLVTGWRNILGVPATQVAREIAADEIDILVDFAGHEQGNVISVLAYKPAPVIISGIGYFASTGLAAVDYFLSDKYLAAAGAQAGFTEKLLVLPHSHFCYTPLRDATSLRASEPPCARNGYITLGSFNNFTKVNREVLAAWRQIMAAMPTAHLLLKASVFNYPESQEYALQRLAAAGLDMARVDCRPVTRDYLGEYADVDIALDTFPYPGGGTTCDALYMGVPVVTLVGASQGERFGGSLLTNIGLGELVTTTVDEYIARVVALASDTEALTLLRHSIPTMLENSPVMDEQNYMREIETAYTKIWQAKCAEKSATVATIGAGVAANTATDDSNTAASEERLQEAARLIDAGELERAEKLIVGATSSYAAILAGFIALQRGDYPLAALQAEQAIGDRDLPRARLGMAYNLLAEARRAQGERARAARYYLASSECKDLASGRLTDYSNYLLNLSYSDATPAEQLVAARGYGELVADIPRYQHDRARHRHEKIRIGYISPDFRPHVVANFLQPLFHDYNKHVFAIYGYALCGENPVSEQLAAGGTTMRYLAGETAEQIAATIYADEIDILVDLAGHTGYGALAVLAYKPAPVIVSGIGYFATTGLDTVDYFLSDAVLGAGDAGKFFTEKLLKLPQSHWCYQPLTEAAQLNSLPARWRGYVTFGTLNSWDKVTDDMLVLWSEILKRVPRSRLYLKSQAFADDARVSAARERIAAAGINLARVTLARPSADYLAAYNEIDIALDTAPYGGGATSCDALYMGVPVVTLTGATHHSHFTASLLECAGLTERCVATSAADYIERAVALATNLDYLQELRLTLRRTLQQTAAMCPERYMIDLENGYRQIWLDYQTELATPSAIEQHSAASFAAYRAGDHDAAIRVAFWLGADCTDEPARIAAFGYYQLGENLRAITAATRLCASYPDDEQMLYVLASSYERAGELPRALALCERYFAGTPQNATIRRSFGYLRAFAAFKMGDRRAPNFYLACYEETRDPDYYSSFLMAHNSIAIAEDELYRYHTRYNEIARAAEYQHPRARHEHRRLRVGYISPDYRLHVMFHFYMTFITHADRDRFEVYTYSLAKKTDDYTKIVAAMSEHFVDLSAMSAADAAAAIYADEIDILVDLAGHTANSALPILAYKPAPVQVSGLGYMATTGLDTVDYLLTDGYVDPPGLSERYFTEGLLRIRSQFCYTQQPVPESAGAPVLERGYVTFGVFNAYRKITDEMLGAWREILARVPHSRLLVKNQVQFAPAMVEHIYKRFTAAGLPLDRVDFEPATVEYMTRYLDVDIALDTYPYPGGGTTCDALYMGVPVVTRYSDRHSTRFAYSILANAGVAELATTSVAEYVERAVALATDTELLDILHKNLRTMLKNSPVMDEIGYMQEVERRYAEIWQAYKESML